VDIYKEILEWEIPELANGIELQGYVGSLYSIYTR